MTTPTFLVIEAQKSGTSWLAAMLGQHPEVFMASPKELHYFDLIENHDRGPDWYRSFFDGATHEKAIDEATPYMLSTPPPDLDDYVADLGDPPVNIAPIPEVREDIPGLVHREYPNLQLVAFLRNPVTRAISGYQHHVNRRRMSPREPFFEAAARFGVLQIGFSYRELSRWLEPYPADRLRVFIFEEDFLRHREQTLRSVFAHLGVDDTFEPQNMTGRYNERRSDPYLWLNYYQPRLARRVFKRFPVLNRLPYPWLRVRDEEIARLHRLYARENQRLEELLDRSLEVWRPSGD